MKISLKRNKIPIIIIGILIIISLNFYQGGIKSFFYSFSSPIQQFFWQKGKGISNFFETIIRINTIKKEVESLKLDNRSLLSEIASLKEIEKENKILRKALEIGLQEEYSLVFAEIISKDFNEDYILIDEGSTAGIVEGQPVITESKIVLGRISEVYEGFARVMLISNKKSFLDAKIQDKEIRGVVGGKGNLSLSLSHVLRDQEIQEGDFVVTTSLGEIFPKGLLVGKVGEIKRSDIEPVQEASLAPFFDLTQLENVFIISKF